MFQLAGLAEVFCSNNVSDSPLFPPAKAARPCISLFPPAKWEQMFPMAELEHLFPMNDREQLFPIALSEHTTLANLAPGRTICLVTRNVV